jgi:hypothetical protein
MRKRGKGGNQIGREGIRERRSRREEAQECERGLRCLLSKHRKVESLISCRHPVSKWARGAGCRESGKEAMRGGGQEH